LTGLANEHNIRLTDISGTGRDGRILKEDVLTYIENSSKTSVVSTDESVAKPVDADSDKSKTQPKPTFKVREEAKTVSDKTEPIKGIKKAMTKTMTQSLNIPHMGLGDEIDVSQLVELRAKLKNLFKDRNITLSYMPFFLKAASMALLEYPILNSSVDDKCENITYKASHNIGVAMDTKQGLLVPNIKNVQNLTILEIAEELNRLQEIGAKNLLSSEDMSNGTFTLSNIGSVRLSVICFTTLFENIIYFRCNRSEASLEYL
jgi:2-oxoisovalerate dehydrogenase E2 component (dihydrolipoyl transacylase)